MEGYGKRVLVAENEESVCRLITTVLEQAGYCVHAVADGVQALSELRKRRFDVVVADWHMPRLDGEQFLLLCRMLWPQTPTVLLSAGLTDLPILLRMQGACALLPKPFNPPSLLQVMQVALGSACTCQPADSMALESQ
ncbi:MAG: Alkaline phosphatase synthesis transcriptional regulatory protein PhoP [Nitrospirae bacterium]|nr:MAG: putative CheY-like response regulator [Nitrospira sp. OLB3]MBV6470455.1 Alkaline phosphatase synthesis transcriptional regulatory protein PhoP [Nitrospirota bacterium]MCK6494382.1 response regulator [Nitrospira sp.]MEB2340322.1 response regulator [Nitrospirales bacterium]QOJ36450.1 MAG: response regulator [Nitrospira sp.]